MARYIEVLRAWKLKLILFQFGFELAHTSPLKQLTLQGFLPMTGKGWVGGGACLPATLMAIRHVNEKPGFLDDYNVTYTWVDTQCNPGVATFKMFQALFTPPTKIMLLGGACSIASEATAQVSHLFNLTQIAWGSASPVLSDRARFPNFYRVIPPDQKLNLAKIALMEEFNWKKVATINQALEFFSMVIDDFVSEVKGTDIHIISQEIFQHDPVRRVENLKRQDARIIFAACYEDKARLILCAAYKIGLYGPKIIWIFASWFGTNFWREKLDSVSCTAEEMALAAEGSFVMGFYFRNPAEERGIAGITVSEFLTLYKEEETYDSKYSMYEIGVTYCYDHVWMAAVALNCSDTYLKQTGYPKTIDRFTYEDSDISSVILSCMSNMSILGLSGSISFGQGADPIKNVRMERIQDGQRVDIGIYIMDAKPRRFEWTGLVWKDGYIPRDSTVVTREEKTIPIWLYGTMTFLAGLGILLALSVFTFILLNRENRIVKLSSPNINNVLLLGCILTYSTVFMKTTTDSLCKAKTVCFCLGFTVAFGALFSKTWRVYKIFTNKKLLKRTIMDYQLIGLVGIMSSVIIVILITWEIVDPQLSITKELIKDIYLVDNDAEVRPYIRICYSTNGVYFSWTIYITEGALLAFGAFLAWETRHVHIEALNDSQQIGMCVYNVVVLSAVGLTFNLLLEENVMMVYGITSGCVILGTTLTQVIVFLPKVMAVYGRHPGNVHAITKINVASTGSKTAPSQLSINLSQSGNPSPSTNTADSTNA